MRRIAIINQKGGVGKTTTTANLGAALAIQGRRVVVVDMDAQANLSLALGVEVPSGEPTSYSVLLGEQPFGACLRATKVPRLSLVASNIDLSGAEMELASAMGREFLLRDALREWEQKHRAETGRSPADYVLFDCPPSLGLLSINALAAAGEVLITLQTEFLALQGMSKLVEIVQLLKRRLNPELVITGIVPTLYDSRLKLAREVLGEIRTYFKGQVVPQPVRANVKLAETPSFAQTIFEYAPDSNGAYDYMMLAKELLTRESRDPDLSALPPFDEKAALPRPPSAEPVPHKRVPPPPRRGPRKPVEAASGPTIPAAPAPVQAPARSVEPASRVAEAPPAIHADAPRTSASGARSPSAAVGASKPSTNFDAASAPLGGKTSAAKTRDPKTEDAPKRAAQKTAAERTAPEAAAAPAPAALARTTQAPAADARHASGKSTQHTTAPVANAAATDAPSRKSPARKLPKQPEGHASTKSDVLQPARKPASPSRNAAQKAVPAAPVVAKQPQAAASPAIVARPTAKTATPAQAPAKPGSKVDSSAESKRTPIPATSAKSNTPDLHAPVPSARAAPKRTPSSAPKATNAAPTTSASVVRPASATNGAHGIPPLRASTPNVSTSAGGSETRIVRAHEMPPLPPDAFEMLSTPFEP